MKRVRFLLAALVLISTEAAWAGESGGQAGAFLRMGVGARAMGLGAGLTGLTDDGAVGYYNPAALPFLSSPQLTFSLAILPLDRHLNYIGFATRLHPKSKHTSSPSGMEAGIALGWINAGVSNIDLRDFNGKPLGSCSNSEHAFYFSFALKPQSWASIGFSAKVLYNRFPKLAEEEKAVTAKGFGLDFGIFINPRINSFWRQLTVGCVVQDVKSKYTWNTEKLWEKGTSTVNSFPQIWRFGVAYRLSNGPLLVLDLHHNQHQGWKVHGGAEYLYHRLLVGRVGYNQDRLVFGLGFRFSIWKYDAQLDYAYDANPITPSAEQYITWKIEF